MHYTTSFYLCTQVTDRITARIHQFTGIRADQEQRVFNQRLCRGKITAKMFLFMEHGRGLLMLCLHTVRGSSGLFDLRDFAGQQTGTTVLHLELKRQIKGGFGTKVGG